MTDDRTRRMRRGTSVTLLVGGAIVVLAIIAPTDLLAIVRGSGPAAPAGSDARPAEVGASVRDRQAVAPVAPDADVPTGTGDAGDARDAGRWGRPAERPTSGPASRTLVEELRGGWRVEAGAEEAAALGVLAAREWVGAQAGVGQGARMVGADVAVTLEAVEQPGSSYAVVTVLAVHGGVVHRLAVPITFREAGPIVAGAPWLLPPPSTGSEPLAGAAIGDEVLLAAARTALERVGIPGTRLVQLEVTDGWPFIARLDDATGGHPWLRWHLDRFVVAGLPLDRAEDGS